MSKPAYSTVKELAYELNISSKWLYRHVAEGKIPKNCYLRVGNHLRFDRDATFELLRKRTDEANIPCFPFPTSVNPRPVPRSLITGETAHRSSKKGG